MARRARTAARARPRKLSCSNRSASSRWSWSGSKKNLSCSDAHELRKLVDHDHPGLSVSRQCALLGLPRSTLYYRSVPVRESTLRIMARIDALYLEDPCSGSRRMVTYLAGEGIPISRDRVRNLMHRMGLRAIYQKPRTTVPGDPAERYPCLVDLKAITAVDQVWATDITYIPLQKGFLHLVAIMDLHSRHVLSWKLSNSLDTEFCLEALGMALSSGRRPQIFHSDQGCQFTSTDFVARLQAEKIKISWSGRKRCYDNILVERLWRTVKYEEVYIHAYSDGWEAEISLARFLWRYCHVRPHSSLGGKTPYAVYTETEPNPSRLELTISGARTVQ
ncbi:IS3 family transposase [Synechococcus sp. A15-44]|uniref:IS3 family transposase n=1 Tax=Synechococcus sp. A15-44 TaxID=1050646 RepID=UPI002102288F|nr:IS3 family transposase [Synechococcus sp. A15-44]